MREIYVIAHNIRSTHNVGSLLRTAEGLGIKHVFLSGYTPYPKINNDSRLPHIAEKLHLQISKTALGAENSQHWSYDQNIEHILKNLELKKVTITALELTPEAIPINEYRVPKKVALLLGSEVDGIDKFLLNKIKTHVMIPMYGKK